jgi:light-regulated signal transduction histidine kinase (bacteriophytochrome)
MGQIALANSPRDYTPREQAAVQRLADLYAMAVHRQRTEADLRLHREHLEDLVAERTAAVKTANEQLQEEVLDRNRAEDELKKTLADLERSNQELEQFAYVASHDLQEPLRMVSSYTQLLARRYQGKLDADAHDLIHYALDGAERMQRLITDLLAFSRVGTRGKPFAPTDCEVVLAQVLDNLKMTVQETGAVITHDPLPPIMADDSQMAQLFQNLMGNALKFRGEAPPQIHLNAEFQGQEWRFSVRDNCIGIAPEFFDRIFIIFQRLHGREEHTGTGIGLAVCKRIVERHGGRIWVESQVGAGSTFYFTIPVRGRKTA